jgi:thymidylate synthase
MNSLDKQYQDLLQLIIDYGGEKRDRTGTGTKSIFGYTIRHNMKNGFPLLTTKYIKFNLIVTELLWFLRGDTNIKYLVDNNCHIWDGDCYKFYAEWWKESDNSCNLTEEQSKWLKLVDGGLQWAPLSQEEFINKIKTDDEFAKRFGDLGPVYGKQWRSWGEWSTTGEQKKIIKSGIDQIANLIHDLKTNPDSRRLIVNAWNPSDLNKQVLPPCHYGFQVYTRELTWEEKVQWVLKNTEVEMENLYIVEEIAKESTPIRAISLMFNMRSCDVPLGLPFNIASYGLLLEIIAKEVNMVPEELISNLGDAHIYLNQIEGVEEQLTRESYPLPKLIINDEYWNINGDLISNIPHFEISDFYLKNYNSHPVIKFPLSN